MSKETHHSVGTHIRMHNNRHDAATLPVGVPHNRSRLCTAQRTSDGRPPSAVCKRVGCNDNINVVVRISPSRGRERAHQGRRRLSSHHQSRTCSAAAMRGLLDVLVSFVVTLAILVGMVVLPTTPTEPAALSAPANRRRPFASFTTFPSFFVSSASAAAILHDGSQGLGHGILKASAYHTIRWVGKTSAQLQSLNPMPATAQALVIQTREGIFGETMNKIEVTNGNIDFPILIQGGSSAAEGASILAQTISFTGVSFTGQVEPKASNVAYTNSLMFSGYFGPSTSIAITNCGFAYTLQIPALYPFFVILFEVNATNPIAISITKNELTVTPKSDEQATAGQFVHVNCVTAGSTAMTDITISRNTATVSYRDMNPTLALCNVAPTGNPGNADYFFFIYVPNLQVVGPSGGRVSFAVADNDVSFTMRYSEAHAIAGFFLMYGEPWHTVALGEGSSILIERNRFTSTIRCNVSRDATFFGVYNPMTAGKGSRIVVTNNRIEHTTYTLAIDVIFRLLHNAMSFVGADVEISNNIYVRRLEAHMCLSHQSLTTTFHGIQWGNCVNVSVTDGTRILFTNNSLTTETPSPRLQAINGYTFGVYMFDINFFANTSTITVYNNSFVGWHSVALTTIVPNTFTRMYVVLTDTIFTLSNNSVSLIARIDTPAGVVMHGVLFSGSSTTVLSLDTFAGLIISNNTFYNQDARTAVARHDTYICELIGGLYVVGGSTIAIIGNTAVAETTTEIASGRGTALAVLRLTINQPGMHLANGMRYDPQQLRAAVATSSTAMVTVIRGLPTIAGFLRYDDIANLAPTKAAVGVATLAGYNGMASVLVMNNVLRIFLVRSLPQNVPTNSTPFPTLRETGLLVYITGALMSILNGSRFVVVGNSLTLAGRWSSQSTAPRIFVIGDTTAFTVNLEDVGRLRGSDPSPHLAPITVNGNALDTQNGMIWPPLGAPKERRTTEDASTSAAVGIVQGATLGYVDFVRSLPISFRTITFVLVRASAVLPATPPLNVSREHIMIRKNVALTGSYYDVDDPPPNGEASMAPVSILAVALSDEFSICVADNVFSYVVWKAPSTLTRAVVIPLAVGSVNLSTSMMGVFHMRLRGNRYSARCVHEGTPDSRSDPPPLPTTVQLVAKTLATATIILDSTNVSLAVAGVTTRNPSLFLYLCENRANGLLQLFAYPHTMLRNYTTDLLAPAIVTEAQASLKPLYTIDYCAAELPTLSAEVSTSQSVATVGADEGVGGGSLSNSLSVSGATRSVSTSGSLSHPSPSSNLSSRSVATLEETHSEAQLSVTATGDATHTIKATMSYSTHCLAHLACEAFGISGGAMMRFGGDTNKDVVEEDDDGEGGDVGRGGGSDTESGWSSSEAFLSLCADDVYAATSLNGTTGGSSGSGATALIRLASGGEGAPFGDDGSRTTSSSIVSPYYYYYFPRAAVVTTLASSAGPAVGGYTPATLYLSTATDVSFEGLTHYEVIEVTADATGRSYSNGGGASQLPHPDWRSNGPVGVTNISYVRREAAAGREGDASSTQPSVILGAWVEVLLPVVTVPYHAQPASLTPEEPTMTGGRGGTTSSSSTPATAVVVHGLRITIKVACRDGGGGHTTISRLLAIEAPLDYLPRPAGGSDDAGTAAGVIIVVGGGIVVPIAAMQQGVSLALLRMAQCDSDALDGESLDFLVHPLYFGLGEGDGRYARGAIVGNLFIIPIVWAAFAYAVLPRLIGIVVGGNGVGGGRTAAPSGDNNVAVASHRARCGWPSIALVPFSMLGEGSMMAAVGLMAGAGSTQTQSGEATEGGAGASLSSGSSPTDVGDIALGAVGVIVLIATVAVWCYALAKVLPPRNALVLRRYVRLGLFGSLLDTRWEWEVAKTMMLTRRKATQLRGGESPEEVGEGCGDGLEEGVGKQQQSPACNKGGGGSLEVPLLGISADTAGVTPQKERSHLAPDLPVVARRSTVGSSASSSSSSSSSGQPLEPYNHLYGEFWWLWASLSCHVLALIVGIAEGMPSNTTALCRGRWVLACLAAVLQSICVLTCTIPLQLALVGVTAVLMCCLAGLVAASAFSLTGAPSPAVNDAINTVSVVSNVTGISLMVVGVVRLCFEFFVARRSKWGLLRRRRRHGGYTDDDDNPDDAHDDGQTTYNDERTLTLTAAANNGDDVVVELLDLDVGNRGVVGLPTSPDGRGDVGGQKEVPAALTAPARAATPTNPPPSATADGPDDIYRPRSAIYQSILDEADRVSEAATANRRAARRGF